MPARFRTCLYGLLILFAGGGCELHSTETPGALVPPTARQDPLLPKLLIRVAGRQRALHLRTFGNPRQPAAFVLPGGPGTDFRLLLPLQALADRYFVVMWDPRGAGLSERVTREELIFESFAEEIAAVKAALHPQGPVTLIAHSFGALFALHYTAQHPDSVSQLILVEPGPLTADARSHYNGGNISFADGQNFFWQNELLSSKDHAAADYKAVSLLPKSLRNFTCDKTAPEFYPMWRFGAYHYYVLTTLEPAKIHRVDWRQKLREYTGEMLVVAGTCGAAAAEWQRRYNLVALPSARLVTIEGANHYTLFLGYQDKLVQVLKGNLKAYR